MTEHTNNEQITPSDSIAQKKNESRGDIAHQEIATDTDNQSLNPKSESQSAYQSTTPIETEIEAQNCHPATTLSSEKKLAGWYDIVVFILMFMASQFIGAFIAIKLGILPADAELFESPDFEIVEGAEFLQARFVAISLLLAMILCFTMLRIYRRIRNWKLKPLRRIPGWASPFRLLCGYLLLWCLSIAIEPITSLFPESQSNMGSGGWLLISAVLIAPIFEEYLFRGYITGTLQYVYGPIVAWLLSSVIFGVAHGQPAVMVSATLSGLVLGFFFLRYRSVILAMLLHAMNNLTVCFLHTFDAEELTLRQIIGNDKIYWAIQIVCAIISLAALVRMFFIIRGIKNEKYTL